MFWRKHLDPELFDAFQRHAALSVEAAGLLVELFAAHGRDAELGREISALEHRADKITHETIARTQKTRPAPYKRAEVHRLISALDDVLDQIEAVSQRFLLFELGRVNDGSEEGAVVAKVAGAAPRELGLVLLDATRALHEAMQLLPEQKQSDRLLQLCVEVNRLENKADALYRDGIKRAYSPGTDPLLALKWRDIYDHLEAATDACEDVANVIEGIVLRYA
ncbi:MAG: DUF47 domain-containing protein [Myxococcales bacterium]|nr:DUF47 domain-containing protein [Myxococcales bacterium]